MILGMPARRLAESDPHWSSVVALLSFDGADSSTTIVDAVSGNSWGVHGNARNSHAQARFGPGSLICDGSGDAVSTSGSSAFNLLAAGNDFTVEMWLRLTDAANNDGNALISIGNGTGYWQMLARNGDAGLRINLRNAATTSFHDIAGNFPWTNGVWYHIAWTREGGFHRLFVDGVVLDGVNQAAIPAAPTLANHQCFVGGNYALGDSSIDGHIDELRITSGVARYTAAFTPPSRAFPRS